MPVARIRSLLSGNKMGQDILWSFGSFGVLAISGVLLNLVIAFFRDASDLGVFNLCYAVYIVTSQIGVMGIHYSVIRSTAYYKDRFNMRCHMLSTAMAMTVLLGALASAVLYQLSNVLGDVFNSPQSVQMLEAISFGLVLFSVNKVLIAYVNGMRHMRAFSIFQGLRYIIVVAWVSAVAISDLPFYYAGFAFFSAEIITSLGAFSYILLAKIYALRVMEMRWLKRHITFGSKSLMAGMFVEFNTRIDVLLIGVFLTDAQVGIYSFAAMMIDGLHHILAMVRVNFSPVLVSALRKKKWTDLQHMMKKCVRWLYPGIGLLNSCVFLGFYIVVEWFFPDKGFQEAYIPLAILMLGLWLIAPFVPFDNLLLLGGFPAYQTLQYVVVALVNTAMNIALLPSLGITGAAIATALAYVVGIAVMVILAKVKVNWWMFGKTAHA